MTRARAVLDKLNIVVRDMDATADFYRRLGLEIPDTLPEWQAHHRNANTSGEIDLDFDSTAFARQWNAGWPASQPGVVVGFRLATRDDVDALYEGAHGCWPRWAAGAPRRVLGCALRDRRRPERERGRADEPHRPCPPVSTRSATRLVRLVHPVQLVHVRLPDL